jgi:hypothetical protein
MRRVILALVFPLLLIAQQGALVHELEHLPSRSQTAGAAERQQPAADRYCDKCFAFAHIAATAGLPALPAIVPVAVWSPIEQAPAAEALAELRSPRNRGPPSLL